MPPTYRQALAEGYMLREYQLGRVLGRGGFAFTYLGQDTSLKKTVAIKEYFPNEIAMRERDDSVVAESTEHEEIYQWGLASFIKEARTLVQFEHPSIVTVHRLLKENNTAYIVMEYISGETFHAMLKSEGTISEARVLLILMSLLDGLKEVHRADFLHRDIKPSNIVMRGDDTPVLIDFGAARQATGAHTRTAVLTPRYAPLEQYSSHGKQGPWTDIYALGAVAYRALTGEAPPEAPSRTRNDPMQPTTEAVAIAQGGSCNAKFLRAVDWALAVDEDQRPQDIATFHQALLDAKEGGVKQSHAEAARWYLESAKQGYADAQNELGKMYANGKGVHKDRTQSVHWYRKAAEQGHEEAKKNLKKLERGTFLDRLLCLWP